MCTRNRELSEGGAVRTDVTAPPVDGFGGVENRGGPRQAHVGRMASIPERRARLTLRATGPRHRRAQTEVPRRRSRGAPEETRANGGNRAAGPHSLGQEARTGDEEEVTPGPADNQQPGTSNKPASPLAPDAPPALRFRP